MSDIVEKTETVVEEAKANAGKVSAFISAHPKTSVAIASIVTGIISLPLGAFLYAVIF